MDDSYSDTIFNFGLTKRRLIQFLSLFMDSIERVPIQNHADPMNAPLKIQRWIELDRLSDDFLMYRKNKVFLINDFKLFFLKHTSYIYYLPEGHHVQVLLPIH
jgi:hypothetical protein